MLVESFSSERLIWNGPLIPLIDIIWRKNRSAAQTPSPDYSWCSRDRGETLPERRQISSALKRQARRCAMKSCTSGKAGGLNCEPLKAVWPDYAGMLATRTSSVDRTVGLLSPALGYSCALALRPAPPLTPSIPSPKSSTPQNSSSDP